MAEIDNLGTIAKEAYTNHINSQKLRVESMLNSKECEEKELVAFLDAVHVAAWNVAAHAIYRIAMQQAMERMQDAIKGYTAQVAVELAAKFKEAGGEVE